MSGVVRPVGVEEQDDISPSSGDAGRSWRTRAPPAWATATVLSLDPPSTTRISSTTPAGTAASTWPMLSSSFSAGMIAVTDKIHTSSRS